MLTRKQHRVKYRGLNVSRMGQPVNEIFPDRQLRSSTVWNANNRSVPPPPFLLSYRGPWLTRGRRFRMRDMVRTACHCTSCKRDTEKMNRRKQPRSDMVDVVCTASAPNVRKLPRLNSNSRPRANYRDLLDHASSEEDDAADEPYDGGITYSFDHRGPRGNAFDLGPAVTRAVELFQTKELAALVKNEYELVNESDTEEDFELI